MREIKELVKDVGYFSTKINDFENKPKSHPITKSTQKWKNCKKK